MKHSQKFLQQRKLAMALPLLVLPFLTMIFWALGGGKGTPVQAMSIERTGLNLELPSAHFNEEEWNKLMLYERAERDSLKFSEERENDPYYSLVALQQNEPQEIQNPMMQKSTSQSATSADSHPGARNGVMDPNEVKVNQKLGQLYQALNKAQAPRTSVVEQTPNTNPADPQFSSDVRELEKMMEMISTGNHADPEMQQIEGMLEKILDIQHPDRVREKIKEQSEQNKDHVLPVETLYDQNISLMNRVSPIASDSALLSKIFSVTARQNSFFDLDEEAEESAFDANAIEAVIHDTQELVAGSTVKMRLMTDVYIAGKLVSKDQFIYGTAAIEGERLTVTVNSIRSDNSLFPVALSAFDLDGIRGIYIPGAITREAAKQSSDQAMQSMQLLSMNQSIGAQAASAGLQAAKGLFSKKVKLVKVTVKAGYRILLQDQK